MSYTLIEHYRGCEDIRHTVSSVREARRVANGIQESFDTVDAPLATFTLLDKNGDEVPM